MWGGFVPREGRTGTGRAAARRCPGGTDGYAGGGMLEGRTLAGERIETEVLVIGGGLAGMTTAAALAAAETPCVLVGRQPLDLLNAAARGGPTTAISLSGGQVLDAGGQDQAAAGEPHLARPRVDVAPDGGGVICQLHNRHVQLVSTVARPPPGGDGVEPAGVQAFRSPELLVGCLQGCNVVRAVDGR